jgi:protoporphyrinogen oxidase
MAATERSWCVVGGGMLGLTLAWRLSRAGQRVTVMEAAPELGGLASAWQLDDIVWDRHYHVTLLSDSYLRALLKELDLDGEFQWRTTQTGFYAEGRLFRLNNAIDYLRFPPLGFVDKVRLAGTIMYASRIEDGRPLERVPLADWLVKLSGRRVFEQIWRPLLRAKLGDNYTQASASFIWAVIRRLYAARRSGLKTEMFGYIPGGYGRVLERFAERLTAGGVALELGCPVERIERSGDGIQVRSRLGDNRFDQVVVTFAGPLAARVCAGFKAEETERLQGIVYQGIVCASLVLKRPLAEYYLTYITDETIPFTAIVEMTALIGTDHLDGRSLIYLPRYVTSDDPFWALSDGEVEERFMSGLRKMYPGLDPEDVLCFRLSRVRQVLAISTLNYSDRLPPMITSVPGLYVVNSAHIVNGTLNVNETVALAEDAMPRLLAAAERSGNLG